MPLIELPDGGFILDEWDEIQPPYKLPDDAADLREPTNDDEPRQRETVNFPRTGGGWISTIRWIDFLYYRNCTVAFSRTLRYKQI